MIADYKVLEKRLHWIQNENIESLFSLSQIGLEKETLRVAEDGNIAQTPHPTALGSALTNPYITTDYSEALTEIITPPEYKISDALTFLNNTQKFVYDNLQHELLWGTSMPCVVAGEASIPIADYGTSNVGKMKTIYRRGLGHRYGKVMQVIAGVHFNYSLAELVWPEYKIFEKKSQDLSTFISENYFSLIRNLLRFGWLIPYLFGASPAVCKSFLGGQSTDLEHFDATTFYHPFATSLRMGDIGYQNNKENESGVKANYNSLDLYVESLKKAIETPFSGYVNIGLKNNGEYQQLNTNILQIENEYYSTVRPKQVLNGNEKPSLSLKKRGVRYVELRSLDINAFDPLGINKGQTYFLEAFMVFCLLHKSPDISSQEQNEIDRNEIKTAHHGRDPAFELYQFGKTRTIKSWGLELCDAMRGICEVLDKSNNVNEYTRSLDIQRESVIDADLTPSARMLAEMKQKNEGFYHFALRRSKQHKEYFNRFKLADDTTEFFAQQALRSHQKQGEIEQSDKISFEEYLQSYTTQT